MSVGRFSIGHLGFEVVAEPEVGVTFALRAPEGLMDRCVLFSGHVAAEMPSELRWLADHLDLVLARAREGDAVAGGRSSKVFGGGA